MLFALQGHMAPTIDTRAVLALRPQVAMLSVIQDHMVLATSSSLLTGDNNPTHVAQGGQEVMIHLPTTGDRVALVDPTIPEDLVAHLDQAAQVTLEEVVVEAHTGTNPLQWYHVPNPTS